MLPERKNPVTIDKTTKVTEGVAIQRQDETLRKMFGSQNPASRNAANEPRLPMVCSSMVNDSLLSKSPGNIPDKAISSPDKVNATIGIKERF